MNKINTETWKKWTIGEIFPPIKVKKYSKIPHDEGDTEFISSSSVNNGVARLCSGDSVKSPCLTVSTNGKCFDCFYHERDIIPSNDVEILVNKNLNEYNGLFICSVIKTLQHKYSYNDKPKNGKVFTESIYLPTKEGEPDWQYMEDYIKSLQLQTIQNIDDLQSVSHKYHPIDTDDWKEFSYDDIFEVVQLKRKLDKRYLSEDGTIPVYSSETSNNGIKGRTNENPDYIVDENNPIYVLFGDHTRSFHFATNSFCVSDNVKVLKPMINNFNALVFITTSWGKNIKNLGYSRHWREAQNTKIKLPAKDGKPDWQYMDEYIERIKRSVANKITILNQCNKSEAD